MLRIIATALRAGRVTAPRPEMEAPAPVGTRGRPRLDRERCDANGACQAACPTGAITLGVLETGNATIAGGTSDTVAAAQQQADTHVFRLDYGACIFCGRCADACAPGALTITADYALAARRREDLVLYARVTA